MSMFFMDFSCPSERPHLRLSLVPWEVSFYIRISLMSKSSYWIYLDQFPIKCTSLLSRSLWISKNAFSYNHFLKYCHHISLYPFCVAQANVKKSLSKQVGLSTCTLNAQLNPKLMKFIQIKSTSCADDSSLYNVVRGRKFMVFHAYLYAFHVKRYSIIKVEDYSC